MLLSRALVSAAMLNITIFSGYWNDQELVCCGLGVKAAVIEDQKLCPDAGNGPLP